MVSVQQIHRSPLNSKGSPGATRASGRGCWAPSAPHPCRALGGTAEDTRSGLVSLDSSAALLPARIGAGRTQSMPAGLTQASRPEKLHLDPRGQREPFRHCPEAELGKKQLFYSLPAAVTAACRHWEGTRIPKQWELSQNCPQAEQQLLTWSAKLTLQRNATQCCLHWGEAVSCSQGTECSSSLSNLKNCFYVIASSVGCSIQG